MKTNAFCFALIGNSNNAVFTSWQTGFSLQPNPTNGLIEANLPSSLVVFEVIIYDANLRVVKKVNVEEGIQKLKMDFSGFPEGLYMVTAKGKLGTDARKVVYTR